ncbi:MAG: NAD+ synthase, partial [Desulfonatronovibrio sp.]
MRVGLLQINPTICDLKGNACRIVQSAEKAFNKGAHFCLTPELAVIGYPPADLLYYKKVVEQCLETVKWIALKTAEMGPVLIGSPHVKSGSDTLFNSAFLLSQGRIEKIFNKTLLPNYDVFDEQRYFASLEEPDFFEISGRKVGVTICEDVWNDRDFWEKSKYSPDPVKALAGKDVDFIVNLSASPFSGAKHKLRLSMLSSLAIKYSLPVIFCNQTGGNDELVFDGRSVAMDRKGQVIASAEAFKEDVLLVDLDDPKNNTVSCSDFGFEKEIWEALTLGLKDYIRKSGFSRVVLGLSGGIDSALVAALAVQALGSENVTGVLMPSRFSSQGSIDHSLELSGNLEMETITIPIDELMNGFDAALAQVFSGMDRDVTEENIQSRIRGNLLMAISNKLGSMVLATGNKSELAVGYTTIYGDMSGGLAPISDVPKTMVYAI